MGTMFLKWVFIAGFFTLGAGFPTLQIEKPVHAEKNETAAVVQASANSAPVSLTQPAISTPNISAESAAVPAPAYASEDTGEYKLQPDDVVHVSVYEEPELSTTARVTPRGEINLPLLGNVKVQGMTIFALQQDVTRQLEADYLVNPQVQVSIQSYHNRTVSVTGAVNKPGSYQMAAEKSYKLMDLVAMAGGFSKVANISKVRIIRSGQNGQQATIEVNAKSIVKGNESKDVEIYPNDVIFVPESWL